MELVSVVIPSFNRFKFLINAIESIKSQTYKHVEIIVVNDCSSEKEYYTYDWEKNNIKIVHLEKNSRELFGFICVGHVRNIGISIATGKYVAFCDDDDIWFPNKLKQQLDAMKRTGCKMSSTEGLFGRGVYDPSNTSYRKYNEETHIDILKNIYKNRNTTFLDNGFPEIWTNSFLKIHNCILCSSVVMEKELLDTIHNMRCVSICCAIPEDYDCWLRATEHSDCVYVKDPCIYYDGGHGYGLNR
jgi:glycosyltransferase involved in cell wall biosynthesis